MARVAVFRDPAGKLRAAHENMAEAQRKRRIEAEIQRVLSEVIAREVKDPRVGNVTITAVNVAADMGTARVYFTPFASINPHEEVRIGLTHAGGFLRGEVGREGVWELPGPDRDGSARVPGGACLVGRRRRKRRQPGRP